MNTDYNNNTAMECFIPGLQLMCLTPEEEDYSYNFDGDDDMDCGHDINWLDDSECQENLATILPLNPEGCIIDSDNHIQSMDGVHLFFEELGFFCEEPEPIDPLRDYDAEFIQERNIKKAQQHHYRRRYHIDLEEQSGYSLSNAATSTSAVDDDEDVNMPSLDDTNSGLSSTSSSIHHDDQQQPQNQTAAFINDLRSPLGINSLYANTKMTAYAYAPHVVRSAM